MPRQPIRLQTDNGREFFNSTFLNLMKTSNIKHFARYSDKKATIVERFNLTLKSRLFTFMTAHGSIKWADSLQMHITAYNNSVHRIIGMKPLAVIKSDENRI